MKEYDSVEFHEDTVIAEDLLLKGSNKALKNLETKSLTIKGNLEVGHELRCEDDLSVDGSIVVGKQIRANRIKIKGEVKADAIHGKTIAIRGSITIQQDLQAKESINLLLQPKKKDCIIQGRIVAPTIVLEIGGSFTKWSLVGPKILKRLGKRSHFKKTFTITDLNIHGTKLVLISFYPPDRADFQFINCEINVEEIEKQQRLPPPVPNRPGGDDLRKTPN
ncbi:MAG: hypothetical protein ACXACI_09030 [Candidatus Hodarchaeales archaeon]|jgi:cytoskeletal protein CcmA (bactofilin family)